jgi:hypothetical protein
MSFRELTSFGRITFKYPTTFAVYTKATAPLPTQTSPATVKYSWIVISDGGTGATPILCMSNGTNWVAPAAAMTTVIL